MDLSTTMRKRLRPRARRGFTLIEMMIIVAIVAIMAAAAAPSIIRLVQDRKSQKDALSVLVLLQDAHTRAYGKGGAVIVKYEEVNASGRPMVTVQESLVDIDRDGTGDVPNMPNPLCTGAPSGNVRFWQSEDLERQTTTKLNMETQWATTLGYVTSQTLCFSPRGRASRWDGIAGQWIGMDAPITFTFSSTSGTAANDRKINLFPNGSSRLRL